MESESEPVRRMATRAMTLQRKMAEVAMETSEENRDVVQTIDYFNSLPDELLILILSYLPHSQLPRCSMVCRRWLRISSDESLWNRTNLRNVIIPLAALAKLIQRGIRYLDMRSARIVEPDPWRRCFPKKYKSKLEVLDASLIKITNRGLAHLLRPCRKLLRFQSMGMDLNRLCCEAIGFNPNLRVLNLFESRGLDARGLTAILKGCPKLEDLNLNKSILSLGTLNALAANLTPSVTTLSLYSCGGQLQNSHVFDIVERCPNLRYLNLGFNMNLTEAAFSKARTLKHLEKLVEDSEFSWNYADEVDDHDFYIDDSDDSTYDDFYNEYDFDDFLDDGNSDDDDINFVHALNMHMDDVDLDEMQPHDIVDDSEPDDDIVEIVTDSEIDSSDRDLFFSGDSADSGEGSGSKDESQDEVDNIASGEDEDGIEVLDLLSSDELQNNESDEDDADIASCDGDDELDSDEADVFDNSDNDHNTGGDYDFEEDL